MPVPPSASKSPAMAGKRILTNSPQGRMTHHRRAFPPDGKSTYYESRNDETLPAIGLIDLTFNRMLPHPDGGSFLRVCLWNSTSSESRPKNLL